jgi:NAD(P)H-flavin reductase
MLTAAERWGGGEAERPFLPRAFSVLRAGAAGRIEFMLHDVGPGTRRLCELTAGDELRVLGPLGIPFGRPAAGHRSILVGGGVGVAPLAILQDELQASPAVCEPRVLLGFRDAAHAAGARLLSGSQVATDDGGMGHHGLVTDLLDRELRAGPPAEVFACGPPGMLEAVRMLCAERAVPAQLALESGMACGFGACFGCVVRTRDGYVRLCVDGPVLAADRLESVVGIGASAG